MTTADVDICFEEPFRTVLLPHLSPREMPRGAVVATAVLLEVEPTESLSLPDQLRRFGAKHEREFGNYQPGRFALEVDRAAGVATGSWAARLTTTKEGLKPCDL
jgi:hypothetical protein